MAGKATRLDHLLVDRGICADRRKAWALITAGQILVAGETVRDAGRRVMPTDDIILKKKKNYASRGGRKLAGALDAFGVKPQGLICMDIGASHGGFTDCLLQRNARRVYAVDVGYGQLDWRLRQDNRVVVMERVNARRLSSSDIDTPINLAVVDVSFISVTEIIAVLPALYDNRKGTAVVLVKPQFEAQRQDVGKGGIVTDPAIQQQAVDTVVAFACDKGFSWEATSPSPIKGAKGNREFFIHLRLDMGGA